MNRFIVLALMSIGLVACGDSGPAIEGKWAWFDVANCEADRDTIEFSGTDFTHRRQGEVAVQGADLAYQETDAEGSPRVTAIYGFNGRTFALTFEPQGENTLIFRGSTIDGVSPPAAAAAAGRELYRCE